MSQAEIDQAMTNGAEVSRAFAFVEQTYSGTPCRECKGRQTIGTIYQGVVLAGCEKCGGATRIGLLANLWSPTEVPQQTQARPILRAAPDRPRNGVPVRRVEHER